ncbi:MAG: DUF4377 domain-containing protein [Acidobacteria bacterium]|nr:MAG: DUF4377 domain-containing protein [Acidobacteriota bacterium]REK01383.1 MAG: DUF4377 domain-containing protein [Acidobacteriota bacterium]REK14339.1 MAG: DUF4377 domain-containing protein [Acidobacteriota bacterium]REK45054.1 MAG: DUF4377 domain-containing protein [Acidobacteriota bacterium]
MNRLLVALLLFTAGAIVLPVSSKAQTVTEEIKVAHYRQFCEGVVPKKCLVVKRQNETEYKPIRDEIEDFNYQAGSEYLLKVEIEKVAAPPKDTSGYIYRLKEVLETTEKPHRGLDIDLYGTKWRLERLDGEAVDKASGAWMAFNAAEGGIYGYGGCNSFGGSFALVEDAFATSAIRSTKRACLIDWGVEEGFYKALSIGGKVESHGGSFSINSEGKELLRFVPFE